MEGWAFDLGSFIGGLISGVLGSFLTFKLTKRMQSGQSGSVTDQSRSSAGRDMAGRDIKK